MRVLMTGSEGIVGTVLQDQLDPAEFDIVRFDPRDGSNDGKGHDATDYEQVVAAAQGVDAIIQLGWDTKRENFLSRRVSPNNPLIIDNIYRAAVECGIERVLVASSVHADRFTDRPDITGLLTPHTVATPDSPYGATKLLMEASGRYYAYEHRLGVVCMRLGCVDPTNLPAAEPETERLLWLSHRDLGRLTAAYLKAPIKPGSYELMYGIGDNEGRIHDITNSIGWKPLDGLKADDFHQLEGHNQYVKKTSS